MKQVFCEKCKNLKGLKRFKLKRYINSIVFYKRALPEYISDDLTCKHTENKSIRLSPLGVEYQSNIPISLCNSGLDCPYFSRSILNKLYNRVKSKLRVKLYGLRVPLCCECEYSVLNEKYDKMPGFRCSYKVNKGEDSVLNEKSGFRCSYKVNKGGEYMKNTHTVTNNPCSNFVDRNKFGFIKLFERLTGGDIDG